MVRIKNARPKHHCPSFYGFTKGEFVIIDDDDGKNRHGYKGRIVAIGKRNITVKYVDMDGYWCGTWRPTVEAYHQGNFERMYKFTPENEHLIGDRSARTPPLM